MAALLAIELARVFTPRAVIKAINVSGLHILSLDVI